MPSQKKEKHPSLLENHLSASSAKSGVEDDLSRAERLTGFGVWKIDLRTGRSNFSPNFLHLFGLKAEELPDSKDFEFLFVIPEDRKLLQNAIQSSLETGVSFEVQVRLVNSAGAITSVDLTGTLEKREFDKEIFMVGRKSPPPFKESVELQESVGLQPFLNSTSDLIWGIDISLNLIYANSAFFDWIKSTGNLIQLGDAILNERWYDLDTYEFWQKKYQKALLGETITVEHELKSSQSLHPIFYETVLFPIYEKEKIIGLACRSKDISEKTRRTEEIKELNQRLNSTQEIAKVGYWETNLKTQEVFWSQEMFRIWEIEETIQPLKLDYFLNSIHPEDQQFFEEKRKQALTEKTKLDVIYRIKLPSGNFKFIRELGEVVLDHDHSSLLFKGVVQDISELMEAQMSLKERNTFIESTLDNLPLGIAVNKISTGEATFLNQAFIDIYGWPAEKLKNVDTFFEKVYPNPEYRNWIKNQIMEDLKSGDPEQMNWKGVLITTQKGQEKVVNAKNIPVPALDLMISTVADDTDRYWAEHSLRISNDRFSLVSEAVSDAIWDWDLVKNTIFWGKGYHTLFGYPENQIQVDETAWLEAIHPEDLPEIWESIGMARRDHKQKYWEGKYRFKKFGGGYAFVHEKTIILRDPKGQPTRMVGALQDITKEKEREEHLKLLESVVTHTSDAILITQYNAEKKDFETIYCNPSFSEITGYSKEEVLGKNPNFLQGEETEADTIHYLNQALDQKTSLSVELVNYRKNGSPFWVSLIIIPVKNHLDEINHWIWSKRDISDQKRREAELKVANERFKLVAEASNDAIWDWDIRNDIHIWGDGFLKLFGIDLKSQEESYKEWVNRVHPEDLTHLLTYLGDLENHPETSRFELEYRFKKSNGEYAEVLDTGAVLRDEKGKLTRLVGAMQDISARKKYENSLKQLNEELKKTNQELELSNQELERFAYIASHDLQEPLRMISSFLGLLERRYDSLLDEKGRQYIQFAIDGAKRMRQIILDLLEFSKLDNFQETKIWIESSELVQLAKLFLKKTLQRSKTVIHLESMPRIYGHKNTLTQLFQNLISNAVKYQPEGQTAEIWIGCEEDEDFWKFSIRDNGLGIDAEYLEKIFIIFQRLHTQDKFSGSGIGLSICKKIADLHQGKIWATSTPGHGSTFFFTLKKPQGS